MESREAMQNMLIEASSLLKKFANLKRREAEIQKRFLPTEGKYAKPWHGIQPIGKKLLVIAAVLLILGALYNPILQILYFVFGFSERLSTILFWIIALAVAALILVVVQECANKMIISKNQQIANQIEGNKQSNIQVQKELMQVKEHIDAVAYKYLAECADYIPPAYRYDANAVGYFASAFANGRADSLKEAINLYETDQHRKRLEEKYDKIYKEQKRHNDTSEFIGVWLGLEQSAAIRQAGAEQSAAIRQAGRDVASSIRGY